MNLLLISLTVASSLVSLSMSAEVPAVRIKDQSFVSLNEALQAAAEGDVLTLTGKHSGNFTVSKSITLSGAEGASLDGQGKGTVLVIDADGVTIENLNITGSGKESTFKTIWGDAGVRVEGDKATLRKLVVSDCDWGVLFLGSKGGKITESTIEGCSRDGIKVLGGEGHHIGQCEINRNQVGLLIDAMYGEETELVLPNMKDMAQMQKMVNFSNKATYTTKVEVVENKLVENANNGIQVSLKSNHIDVLRNQIERTGRGASLSEDGKTSYIKAYSVGAGVPPDEAAEAVEMLIGTAILLNCGPHHIKVIGNQCRDNKGMGVGLVVAEQNRIEGNHLTDQRIGIHLERSNENHLLGNEIQNSSEYGMALGATRTSTLQVVRSDGNVLSGNKLIKNKVNAFDGTTQPVTREAIAQRLEKTGVPGMPASMLSNPGMKKRLIDSIHKTQQMGENQWHDGTKGNHYDDFDEPSEGFKDTNGDGVCEEPYSIPGGSAVDPHALAADAGS